MPRERLYVVSDKDISAAIKCAFVAGCSHEAMMHENDPKRRGDLWKSMQFSRDEARRILREGDGHHD